MTCPVNHRESTWEKKLSRCYGCMQRQIQEFANLITNTQQSQKNVIWKNECVNVDVDEK